jgi:hypothetical protein
MGLFTTLVVRSNGSRVTAAWWNDIRNALIAVFGTNAIPETAFTIANNSGAADVTGLTVAGTGAVTRSAFVEYDIRRKTDTALSEVREMGCFWLYYNYQTGVWAISDVTSVGDDSGVVFSISAGQVQYTSTNIAGANYVGQLHFRARMFNA